ncbi:hypothetical protein [Desulfogranum japonicum]|uniref:hypothetical protein n=1 Tax=Desulfogranum japonicum TaxID=231447 RepID=UPI00040F0715|nr:hypothetical protein [Desulfogranum japonicum]
MEVVSPALQQKDIGEDYITAAETTLLTGEETPPCEDVIFTLGGVAEDEFSECMDNLDRFLYRKICLVRLGHDAETGTL